MISYFEIRCELIVFISRIQLILGILYYIKNAKYDIFGYRLFNLQFSLTS